MHEPLPNGRYQDKQGNAVTVRQVAFSRVTFVRDGYTYPAFMLVHHFSAQYSLIPEARHA